VGPLESRDLPEDVAALSGKPEPLPLGGRNDDGRRVHPGAEVPAQQAGKEIRRGQAGPREAALPRKAHDEEAPRPAGGRPDERVRVGVAAHDPVHDDRVGGSGEVGLPDDVAELALRELFEPLFAQKLLGGLLIRGRQLQVQGALGAGVQKLDLDGSHAAPDLEHGGSLDAPFL
jgi:hypothetical protein